MTVLQVALVVSAGLQAPLVQRLDEEMNPHVRSLNNLKPLDAEIWRVLVSTLLMSEHIPGEEIRTKHKEPIRRFITDLTLCPRTSLSPTMWANRQLIPF
jgi:hypothetical protein